MYKNKDIYKKIKYNKFSKLGDYERKLVLYKIKHRQFCMKKLKDFKSTELKSFNINSSKEAILIEFRRLPHLEFLLRNTINLLDNTWSHTVVCGNDNYNFIYNMCKNINNNIKIIKINYNNIVKEQYNKLLYNVSFWKLFNGTKLLLYQEDTIMFHGNIDKFLKYDYVGAPWATYLKNKNPHYYRGGNGGFSLRDKDKIIECLEKNKPNINNELMNEDVYFSIYMENVCPRELSKEFSQETIKGINPVGGHCYWMAECVQVSD